MEQIPLFEGVIQQGPKEFVPPETEVFLVAAFQKGSGGYPGRWSIRRETAFQEYATYDSAVEAANKLSAQWTAIRIIKVVLK